MSREGFEKSHAPLMTGNVSVNEADFNEQEGKEIVHDRNGMCYVYPAGYR
jgi:hypothetical protein